MAVRGWLWFRVSAMWGVAGLCANVFGFRCGAGGGRLG
ncbi:hypothetical protein MKSMC1_40890 [Mycobacterium kansasii]|nr:hypothetical protein MKSMC1_40890 [Mycobacterium kansasii]